ncbi:MAG TPA: S8 family serine peptidase [Bacteroidales bacterium]|nr:S8 family serine peptidase [Bacteroidales bacterium]
MKIHLQSILLTALLALNTVFAPAQGTNEAALKEFARQKEKEYHEATRRVQAYARRHRASILEVRPDGTMVQMVDVVNGRPVYIATDNVGAATTTRAFELWEGGSSGLNLAGEGYDKLGEWDGGAVRRTHQEFNNTGEQRVTQSDGATSLSDHATHVAGTLVGGGVVANAKGMAHKGLLKANDWNNAESEMANLAAQGLEISNHSYGWITGWNSSNGVWTWHGDSTISNQEDWRFGFYGNRSRDWDVIANNAPYYLIVKSAGNDRGQGPSNAGTGGLPPVDGGLLGYDCISDGGTAKNAMAIGAVNQVNNYTSPASVVMSSFSCWGPTDDGRIKPDVVAKGVSTYSAGSNSNTHYSTKSGTSMSSPNAAGTMALLQQHYQQTHNGQRMRSSTLRALVIHTADEAGTTSGPDYRFGWGLMNALKAAELISQDDVIQNVIDEIVLENGTAYTRQIQASGTEPLRVTIAWIDPPGTVLPPQLNPRTPMLVHNLDLRVIGPDQTEYFPYRLNPDNPQAAALNDEKNNVDNVELVHIDNPVAGTYTIVVDHQGSLQQPQNFSLIISGINEFQGIPFCSPGLISPEAGSQNNLLNVAVSWQPAPFATSYLVFFGSDGQGIETPTNILNGVFVETNAFEASLQPGTTYYLKVIPINDFGANDECSNIWSFNSIEAISNFPYVMNFEQVAVSNIPAGWQQQGQEPAKWLTTSLISHEGTRSMGCYNTSGLTLTSLDHWLFSQPVVLEAGKEYMLRFAYRAFMPGTSEQLSVYWGESPETLPFGQPLLSLSGFDGATGWQWAETLIIPAQSGMGYLAWRAHTPQGYGVFIDDILIENWGTVGLTGTMTDMLKARYEQGKLFVFVPDNFNKAHLILTDASGRSVLQTSTYGATKLELPFTASPGVYFLRIEQDGRSKGIKVLVNN